LIHALANANKLAKQQFPDAWKGNGVKGEPDSNAPTGTPGIFDAYYANYWSQMWQYSPWKATGKLFFNAGSCSASVISGQNIIVTAAHCVYNTDSNYWYNNWVFSPAYRFKVASPAPRPAWSMPAVTWVDRS